MSMETRSTALENRLRQTERALVVERLARQAQQTVETWPAGVDAEEIGTLPTFSGDLDLGERTDSMPWGPSGVLQSRATSESSIGRQSGCCSKWDPIITDSTAMTRAEKTVLGTSVLGACSDLQGQGAAGGPTRVRATSLQ